MRTRTTMAIIVTAALCGASGCILTPLLAMQQHGSGADELGEACVAVRGKSLDADLCGDLGRPHNGEGGDVPPVVARAALLLERHDSNYLPQRYERSLAVDLDELDHTLAASPANRTIARAFLIAVKKVKDGVAADVAAETPGWRAVYVAPAVAAGEAWQAGAARRAPWLAKATAAIERADRVAVSHKQDPGLLDAMVALHREYVADCRGAGVAVEECLGDEVARPLTKRIVQLAWDQGDHERARAERELLLEVPDVSERDYAVRRAAAAAVVVAKEERDAWNKAKAQGRSAAALRERWPDEPPAIDDDVELAGADAPKATDGIDTGDRMWPATSRAVVASVTRSGARAVITFKRDVESYEASYDCHDGSKVESIDDQGRLHYEQKCDIPVSGGSMDITTKPISVPREEAEHLRATDVVTFVEDDHRRGHVVQVQAGDAKMKGTIMADDEVATPTIQLAAIRLDPPKPEVKAARKPRR